MESKKNFFNPTQVTFKTSFNKVDSSTDLDLDLIIIFDGGDVNGYEKDLEDYIQTAPRN